MLVSLKSKLESSKDKTLSTRLDKLREENVDIEKIKGYSNSEESRGDNAGDADYIDLGYGFYDEIH